MTISLSLLIISTMLISHQNNPLQNYRWKNRIILLYAHETSEAYYEQRGFIKSDAEGIEERDLLIFELFKKKGYDPDGQLLTNYDYRWFMNKYIRKQNNFQFTLIGKDGGVKLDADEPVTNKRLFGLIDRMPMRIQDMKKNK